MQILFPYGDEKAKLPSRRVPDAGCPIHATLLSHGWESTPARSPTVKLQAGCPIHATLLSHGWDSTPARSPTVKLQAKSRRPRSRVPAKQTLLRRVEIRDPSRVPHPCAFFWRMGGTAQPPIHYSPVALSGARLGTENCILTETYLPKPFDILFKVTCGGGEIGRRTSLRC